MGGGVNYNKIMIQKILLKKTWHKCRHKGSPSTSALCTASPPSKIGQWFCSRAGCEESELYSVYRCWSMRIETCGPRSHRTVSFTKLSTLHCWVNIRPCWKVSVRRGIRVLNDIQLIFFSSLCSNQFPSQEIKHSTYTSYSWEKTSFWR
jgi:hypothetical protein